MHSGNYRYDDSNHIAAQEVSAFHEQCRMSVMLLDKVRAMRTIFNHVIAKAGLPFKGHACNKPFLLLLIDACGVIYTNSKPAPAVPINATLETIDYPRLRHLEITTNIPG